MLKKKKRETFGNGLREAKGESSVKAKGRGRCGAIDVSDRPRKKHACSGLNSGTPVPPSQICPAHQHFSGNSSSRSIGRQWRQCLLFRALRRHHFHPHYIRCRSSSPGINTQYSCLHCFFCCSLLCFPTPAWTIIIVRLLLLFLFILFIAICWPDLQMGQLLIGNDGIHLMNGIRFARQFNRSFLLNGGRDF